MIRVINPEFLIGDAAINEKFGALVTIYRGERGFDQAKLADKLKINKKSIVRLEEKNGAASAGDYFIICLYLGIKVVDFWRYLISDETCELTQVETPTRSKTPYGLHESLQGTDYVQLWQEVERCLAERLKKLRNDGDKTLDQMVDYLSVSARSLVHKVENGSRSLRLSELEKYCNVLQVKSEAVIDDVMKQVEINRLARTLS